MLQQCVGAAGRRAAEGCSCSPKGAFAGVPRIDWLPAQLQELVGMTPSSPRPSN